MKTVTQAPTQQPHTTVGSHASSAFADVAVIGLGYVGLPLALLASRKGHSVLGIDVDEQRVSRITQGLAPFVDADVTAQLMRTTMRVSTNFSLLKDVPVIIICVPTPVHEDYTPNLEPLKDACRAAAEFISEGTLVIVESTVNPGVCERTVLPILEKTSGKKGGVDFHLSHCPERVNPGDHMWGVENINRVAGSLTPEGLEKTLTFYRTILSADVHPMATIREAEAVKIVENTFRDINIAFVNELAMSFDKLGIDIMNVLRGASTKPFAFLPHFPSCGVGGHCIPVDPYYLIAEGKRNGFHHEFLTLARRINNLMPHYAVDTLERAMRECKRRLPGSRIAVLGLSYKGNVDDTRESPSFKIIEELKRRRAKPVVFDPYVGAPLSLSTLAETLQGASAAIIATDHREFRALLPEDFLEHNVSIVVDGKNCLPKEMYISAGITYRGIGR